MPPEELLKTICLGDSGCKGIYIDFWKKKIKLKFDCIARVRCSNGKWEYYDDENFDDGGYVVFSGVESYKIDPMGRFADEFVHSWSIEDIEEDSSGKNIYTFVFEVYYSVDAIAMILETMTIEIKARELWLEDTKMPGVKITD